MSEDDFVSELNTILLEHDAAILEAEKFSARVEVRRQTRKQILDLAKRLSPDASIGDVDVRA